MLRWSAGLGCAQDDQEESNDGGNALRHLITTRGIE
jgi:hypothetical protein